MKVTNKYHFTALTVAVLLLVGHVAVASFVGVVSDKKEKYSLKNFNKLNRSYSLSALHISNNLQFRGVEELVAEKNGESVEVISMMRLEKGNTSYIFPYRYKVKVPKFKTPAPPPFR